MEKNWISALAIDQLNAMGKDTFPGFVGIRIVAACKEIIRARLVIRPELLAPNGYLHGATVVALADTTCGCGTRLNLPKGAKGFTTIELKSNFTGTLRQGALICEGKSIHTGNMTQVWDAEVSDEKTGHRIALFRCTQMILFENLETCLKSGMAKEASFLG